MKKFLLLCAIMLASISTVNAYGKALGDIPGRTRGGVATMDLTENDEGYIVSTVVLLVTQIKCKAIPTEGGLGRLGDRNGIDVTPINRAILAALGSNSELPYEIGDVIPAVTRIVNLTHAEVIKSIAKDKPAACTKWVDLLRQLGVAK